MSGFREIQFDYIRFNDSPALRHVSKKTKYAFIESFLQKAKESLKEYNVKIAADVFGRIPLNNNDIIGQKMESLDKVVDIICPMAYPSHYTWKRKGRSKYFLQHNPYYTVEWTSRRAKERTKNASIVAYLQAFKHRMPRNMTFDKYITEQIKAVHDTGIKGFLLWNARQDYKVPFRAMKLYYQNKSKS